MLLATVTTLVQLCNEPIFQLVDSLLSTVTKQEMEAEKEDSEDEDMEDDGADVPWSHSWVPDLLSR